MLVSCRLLSFIISPLPSSDLKKFRRKLAIPWADSVPLAGCPMALPRWCPTPFAQLTVNQAANLSCWHHACWGEYWNNSRAVRDARLSVSAPALFCLRLQRYGAKYRPHEFFCHFFQKILQNHLSVLIFRYLAYSNRYAVAGIPFPCPPLLILRTVVMLVILSYCQSWFSKLERKLLYKL